MRSSNGEAPTTWNYADHIFWISKRIAHLGQKNCIAQLGHYIDTWQNVKKQLQLFHLR